MRKNDGRSRSFVGVPVVCTFVSVLMLVLKPVPGGRHYEYALLLSLALTALGFLASAAPRSFFGQGALAFVLFCGLGLGAVNLAVISSDSEIVRTYQGVFD